MMTRKARALGMNDTLYRNASGLPNPEQITTARDQALLGRAIQDRFPKYYRYFATPSFTYRGHAMRNHNRLLGNVEGVDGIKTGYVAASGFNLVIVGPARQSPSGRRRAGRTYRWPARCAHARTDCRTHHRRLDRRTVAAIAEAPEGQCLHADRALALLQLPQTRMRRRRARRRQSRHCCGNRFGGTPSDPAATPPCPRIQNEDLKPIAVKTVKVKASTLQTAAIGSVAVAAASGPSRRSAVHFPRGARLRPPPPLVTALHHPSRQTVPPQSAPVRTATMTPRPACRQQPQHAEARPAKIISSGPKEAKTMQIKWYRPAKPNRREPAERAPESVAKLASIEPDPAPNIATRDPLWLDCPGRCAQSVEAAKDRLAAARNKAISLLGRADAFTEPVTKGDKTLHRARFAGLDKDHAEAACKTLNAPTLFAWRSRTEMVW